LRIASLKTLTKASLNATFTVTRLKTRLMKRFNHKVHSDHPHNRIYTEILAIAVITFWLVPAFICDAQNLTPPSPAPLAHSAFNHSEDKIPPYVEPDILRDENGAIISTVNQWTHKRRPESLALLRSQMFGFNPTHPVHLHRESVSISADALDGAAIRKQIILTLPGAPEGPRLHLLLYLPSHTKGRVPVFLGLNDSGNQSVSTDPGIELSPVWVADPNNRRVLLPRTADDSMRGHGASQWPIRTILARGYGLATIYADDLEPDFLGGEAYGFRASPMLAEEDIPVNQRWGALGVWAWGLSRALDYLITDPGVDGTRVAVIGHSRFGKAALWAGAQDTRFALVISNESGKGGAALLKRNFGETVANLNTRFPYWFCPNFRRYTNNEQALPFDSPFLLALVAPRPLYVASSSGEYIVDPLGEFLAAAAVGPVYKLFGEKGLGVTKQPPIGQPIFNQVGYHLRYGKHDMTAYDWEQYLAFADIHLKDRLTR